MGKKSKKYCIEAYIEGTEDIIFIKRYLENLCEEREFVKFHSVKCIEIHDKPATKKKIK